MVVAEGSRGQDGERVAQRGPGGDAEFGEDLISDTCAPTVRCYGSMQPGRQHQGIALMTTCAQ
jgi:hypothetical protein